MPDYESAMLYLRLAQGRRDSKPKTRVIGWGFKKSLPATCHRRLAGAGYRVGF